VPIAGLAATFIVFFLKVDTPKTPLIEDLVAMDWLGTITIVGVTVMFLLGLGYGGLTYPWSSVTVVCLMVFGVATLFLFLLIE
jgi:hypothetical protein